MWPVVASDDGPELATALRKFMEDRLRLSSVTLAKMGSISIKKVFSAPSARIQNEVIALFESNEVRDAVRRAAKELAGNKDSGIRLEIPLYLQPSLKALEAVSFALKKKNPGMSRNVKFDDERLDLVLDFCLNPEAITASWRKLGPAQAMAMKQRLGAPGAGARGRRR